MSEVGSLPYYLDSYSDWGEVNRKCNYVFKEGHLDEIDDLIPLILPILNITYYKQVRWLDDRLYAKEDLIQDTIMTIYMDMKLRWDKYIDIDNYPRYFEKIARNVMIKNVHKLHSYYSIVELDPDLNYNMNSAKVSYESVEAHMIKSTISSEILNMTKRLASYRGKYAKILLLIVEEVYEKDNPETANLKSRLKVVGISEKTYELLYNHVLYLHKLAYNYQKSIMKGNHRMRLRIEDILRRYESPTYEILATNYSDSIIPEVYAEFGDEVTRKFVKTFSGKTIEVPDYQKFCDDLLGGTVYAIAKGDRNNLYQFAADNGMSFRTLARIFDKVAKFYGGKQKV